MYLAIDPGGSTKKASIGYALFSLTGEEVERGAMTKEELYIKLDWSEDYVDFDSGWIVREVVIENFINNAKSRGGQTNGTSEVIGAVEYVCHKAGIPFHRQPNTILPVAQLLAHYRKPMSPRTKKPVQHLPDQDSAYLHGFYFLVNAGVIIPKGRMKPGGER